MHKLHLFIYHLKSCSSLSHYYISYTYPTVNSSRASVVIMVINTQGFLTVFHCAWSPPEDEQQQKTLSGNKTVRQLTMERDQAMADLNSVERSLSDLFRRYENLKTVLEGFKKVRTRIS